jgi:hypothetical protein
LILNATHTPVDELKERLLSYLQRGKRPSVMLRGALSLYVVSPDVSSQHWGDGRHARPGVTN